MNRSLLFLPFFLSQWLAAQPISWLYPCTDKVFCLNQNVCTVGDVFMTEHAVTNCGNSLVNYSYKIDLNNNGSVDIQSSNDTVSGPFALGTHKITWKANDNCGNVVQCTYLFQIKDCQPPSLLCINGLTQSLQKPECQQAFTASQFILSMSDNCTPTNQIQLGIRRAGEGTGFPNETSITMDSCDEGFNAIEVWAKDGNGITNMCSNHVVVQDGDHDCTCDKDADVLLHGCARTAGNTKISTFSLKTRVETLPGAATPWSKNYAETIPDSCYTGLLGQIPFGAPHRVTVRAERPTAALEGVTTFDLVLISKHILAIEPLTSVYQTAAADVNRSNSVTTFDIVETRKLILGIYDTFPLVPAWRLTRPVADPSQVAAFNALKDTYQIMLPNLVGDLAFHGFDFVGIKYGDVNGTASLTGEPSADDRYTAPPMLFHTDDLWLDAGEEATVAFHLAEPAMLEGWQMALETAPATLQILEASGLPEAHFNLRGHELRGLWADGEGMFFDKGETVFKLKIRALKATRLSDALFFNSENLRPEAYSARANGTTERRPLLLHFGGNTDAAATFFPPRPNPFVAETSFEILLKNPTLAHLEVFDLNGRRIFSDTYDLGTGLQTLRLPASALPSKGVFAYRLTVGAAVSSGRLVRV